MTDHELDTLVSRAATISDTDIATWTRNAPYEELCEEIMSTTPVHDQATTKYTPVPTTANRDSRSPRRPRRSAFMAVAAAAVAVLALGLVINLRGNDGAENTAWAAELVEFAERSPLMLVDDPAWTVTYADENGDEGEMTFTNNGQQADLHWRAGPLSEWLDDRLNSGTDRGTQDIVNGTATIVQYDGGNEYTALWSANGQVLEFRTQSESDNDFRDLLDALSIVDVNTWLSAMPASVVGSADQPAAISDMLTGIPVPDGFHASQLADDAGLKDRYQLGARVVAAVSCTWIEQWIDASATGDAIAAQEAVDAMNTSGQWPIILEMNQSGAYGQVLQMIVDGMTNEGGISVADSYQDALGCGQ